MSDAAAWQPVRLVDARGRAAHSVTWGQWCSHRRSRRAGEVGDGSITEKLLCGANVAVLGCTVQCLTGRDGHGVKNRDKIVS
jgi:hypothetical protein